MNAVKIKREPAEKEERILFLDYCIAQYANDIEAWKKRMRRLHAERSVARARCALINAEFYLRQCQQERLSLVNDEVDVEFVTSAGKRYLHEICEECGKPIAVGYKPIVLKRTSGVWTMRCWICNDAKYEV